MLSLFCLLLGKVLLVHCLPASFSALIFVWGLPPLFSQCPFRVCDCGCACTQTHLLIFSLCRKTQKTELTCLSDSKNIRATFFLEFCFSGINGCDHVDVRLSWLSLLQPFSSRRCCNCCFWWRCGVFQFPGFLSSCFWPFLFSLFNCPTKVHRVWESCLVGWKAPCIFSVVRKHL